jgi:hypothetical protein
MMAKYDTKNPEALRRLDRGMPRKGGVRLDPRRRHPVVVRPLEPQPEPAHLDQWRRRPPAVGQEDREVPQRDADHRPDEDAHAASATGSGVSSASGRGILPSVIVPLRMLLPEEKTELAEWLESS